MKPLHLLIIITALMHFNVSAQWIEATGQAKIINGNITQAREDAIEQALSYVALRSGGSFSSEQQTQNGRLTQDKFSMSNQTQVSHVELLNERIEKQTLTVNLRVDIITSTDEKCHLDPLKAAILVPQAQISDRAQLRYGNLGNLQKAMSERLGFIMRSQAKASFPNVHANERLDIEQSLVDIRGYRLPSWLSEITDSQYVLLPEIIDISTDPIEASMFGLWDSYPQRQFQLRLSLYHGISGEQIWSEYYNSPALWEFEKQITVPAHSNRFWASSYGKNIDSVLMQASEDIDNVLNCRPLLGQIVSRQNNRVIINLGRNNGIKVGDSFQLVLQQNLPDRLDNMRAVAGKSRATIKIDQVTQESATAVLEGANAALNIQINDIAIKI
ncbi:flagellar biosynthesis protein FlgT [Shewanella colwelliana]|uniref:Flagellar biosynthesis protein FlgT n=1 Tax=Shewanella colwelliana TaxID=23 RepID=A0A1E5IVS9_SHECO|nr:flagellar assembly protein FlgT [Shewanella colwelliana]OEG74606.1 flagellar biosynthesis protein FlgT [Shewanella colwelliana]